MRRLTLLFVIAAFAITALSAQDLDKILNDHYKASAQDKISKITSTTMIGKSVAMGMETEMAIYQARPNNLRLEVNVMDTKIIQTYNGTTGWLYAPIRGVTEAREMTHDELKTVLDQADMDSPLWDYKAKGKSLELLGTSDDGSAYKLKLSTSEGDVMTIFISKKTSLLSKIITTQMAQGMETEIEIELKDYKVVKGIPTAHYMAIKMGGQVMSTTTFESVEYNKALDSAIFEKPVIE
jgi:outer membrane lipoprotein-sorting protein